MYKIIGADQKEYGPVTADQIRQWIAEGRANAQTMVRREGETEWKPLAGYPEFAPALGAAPSAAAPPPFAQPPGDHTALAPDVLERDYDLDIGNCIGRGWELVKNNFWPVVGISLLVLFAAGAVNQIIGLISRPAMQAMIERREFSPSAVLLVMLTSILSMPVETLFNGGLFRYYLKLIRGEQVDIGDAFSGFRLAFGPLLLLGFVKGLLTLLGILLCVVPGIYLSVAWFFALPLVIDRQMDFWPAMELSRKVVSRHWFTVFGLILLAGLVSISGIFACCVGIFVTIPIGLVSLMYAYEDIFNRPSRPS
jgi:uncharacterized membrane protein